MTTNRDWLYTLQPRDRTKWLDAEHVEPNDDLSPEKGVSGGVVDVTTEKRSKAEHDGVTKTPDLLNDSQDKLYEDANSLCVELWDSDALSGWNTANMIKRRIIELLDRQEAITAREVKERVDFSLITQTANAMFPDYQERIAELQAKVDGLTAERDEWRKRALQAESKGANQRLNSLRNTLRRDWHTETVWQDAQSVYRLRVDPDVLHPIPNFTRNEVYRSSMLERDEIIGDLTEENERLAEKARRIDEADSRWEYMRRDLERITAERDMWRERCGKMLDAAHELARIAEVDA